MKKARFAFAGICFVASLMMVSASTANAQKTDFTGTWNMTIEAMQGGGGRGNRAGGAQSLVITKDGDNYKVTHKAPRGEFTSDATVSGNTISWTEEHPGRNGNTFKIDFKATVDGDSMKGTMGAGQFSRNFTAKRAS
jgi:hypothetical protein